MKILQIFLICEMIIIKCKCAKNEDEGRPYEFGFTIDGQQHRYEKKGVNGIIQGEFGFITADGIYHVTTYATDENGAFRILSMRNVRISDPLDGSGGTYSNKVPASAVQTAGNDQKPIPNTISTNDKLQAQPQPYPSVSSSTSPPVPEPNIPPKVIETTTKAPVRFTTQSTIKPACASCGYVTRPPTTKKPIIPPKPFHDESVASYSPSPPSNLDNNYKPIIYTPDISQQQVQPSLPSRPSLTLPSSGKPQLSVPVGSYSPSSALNKPGYAPDINQQQVQPALPSRPSQTAASPGESQISLPNRPSETVPLFGPPKPEPPNRSSQTVPQPPSTDIEPPASNENYQQQQQQQGHQPNPEDIPQNNNQPPVDTFARPPISNQPQFDIRTPDDGFEKLNQNSAEKIKVENGTIFVPNHSPIKIKDKYPNMVDGLPDGIEEKDIVGLLYKFNYTIGFHGHYERGLRNGTKIGGYFVNGRDGYSRIVTYVADELGYRPKFRLINLGLDSPYTPKEDTEKSFGLKNFEFVWYPLS